MSEDVSDYYSDFDVAQSYDSDPQPDSALIAEDIPFYVALAAQAAEEGTSVLELACGTGRVTLPMAQTGARVTGLDRAAPMLEVARAKTDRDPAVSISWVEADMTRFCLKERFGLIVMPGHSFNTLLETSQQKDCLRLVYEHLGAGGRFAFNTHNSIRLFLEDWTSEMNGFKERRQSEDKLREIWIRRHVSLSTQVLQEDRTEFDLDVKGKIVSRTERKINIRYIFRYEMEHLLSLSGLALDGLYGNFDMDRFSEDSNEMVWITRKQ